MNPNPSLKSIFAGAIALAALSLTSVATAGPGLDYWRRMADTKESKPSVRTESAASEVACTDSKVVQVTETKNAWQNGRGPAVTTVTGTKRVCTTCGGTTTEAKRTWLNGKGPTVITKVARQHDCVNCGDDAKS
jgi:hypothetical protein